MTGRITPEQARAELARRGLNPDGTPMRGGADRLPAPTFNTVRGAPPGVMSSQLRAEDEILESANAEVSRLGTATQQANRFNSLMMGTTGDPKRKPQGTGAGLRIPGALDVRVALGDRELSEMEQINNALAPLQRQAGSGAMSDKDLAVFQRSIVDPRSAPDANQAYVAITRAASQRARDYRDFLQAYRARFGPGSLSEAQRVWNGYANENPLFDDNGRPMRGVRSWRDHFTTPAPQQGRPRPAPARQQQQSPGVIRYDANGRRIP